MLVSGRRVRTPEIVERHSLCFEEATLLVAECRRRAAVGLQYTMSQFEIPTRHEAADDPRARPCDLGEIPIRRPVPLRNLPEGFIHSDDVRGQMQTAVRGIPGPRL